MGCGEEKTVREREDRDVAFGFVYRRIIKWEREREWGRWLNFESKKRLITPLVGGSTLPKRESFGHLGWISSQHRLCISAKESWHQSF